MYNESGSKRQSFFDAFIVHFSFLMRRLSPFLGPLFGIALLAIAVLVLRSKLSSINPWEVWWQFTHTPASRTVGALLLTAIYYVLITGYDALAFRVIGHPLRYRRIALASFTGYAFSHSVGFSALSGGSVRYRIHSSFGLTMKETAKVVAFNGLTFWVGFLTVAGIAFLIMPIQIPPLLRLPFRTVQPIGWIALLTLASYAWIVTHALHGKKIGSFVLPHLKPKYVLLQMLLGTADWLVGAGILFVLLPGAATVAFPGFFGMFMLAQVAGLVSQLPGGIGVFEGVLLILLNKHISAGVLLGVLILYRIIYYILPLLAAILLLVTHEVRLGRGRFRQRTTPQ